MIRHLARARTRLKACLIGAHRSWVHGMHRIAALTGGDMEKVSRRQLSDFIGQNQMSG